MSEGTAAKLVQAGLASVWGSSYPLVLERVAAIETAAAELSKASPRAETVRAGRDDAHKLAGVLGTFGLDRGTELARALEWRLTAPRPGRGSGDADHLAAELRTLVERAHPYN